MHTFFPFSPLELHVQVFKLLNFFIELLILYGLIPEERLHHISVKILIKRIIRLRPLFPKYNHQFPFINNFLVLSLSLNLISEICDLLNDLLVTFLDGVFHLIEALLKLVTLSLSALADHIRDLFLRLRDALEDAARGGQQLLMQLTNLVLKRLNVFLGGRDVCFLERVAQVEAGVRGHYKFLELLVGQGLAQDLHDLGESVHDCSGQLIGGEALVADTRVYLILPNLGACH